MSGPNHRADSELRAPPPQERALSPDPLPATPIALVWLSAFAIVATAAPLTAYTASLALFGAAHVLRELRYVEARFGRGPLFAAPRLLGLGLLLVAGLRIARALGLSAGGTTAELIVVAGLAALALPTLLRRGGWAAVVGILVVGVLLLGLAFAPALLLVALAGLHNWTPAGFLAEALPAAARPRALRLGLLAFGLLPLLIATGLPGALFGGLALPAYPSAGPLSEHLFVYLPAAWIDRPAAAAIFSAFTYAQLLHYAVVIGILPRIAPGGPQAPAVIGLSRLPLWIFVGGVVALSLVSAVGHGIAFTEARRWYGVIAAVHAWIELPALLLALGAPPARA